MCIICINLKNKSKHEFSRKQSVELVPVVPASMVWRTLLIMIR